MHVRLSFNCVRDIFTKVNSYFEHGTHSPFCCFDELFRKEYFCTNKVDSKKSIIMLGFFFCECKYALDY